MVLFSYRSANAKIYRGHSALKFCISFYIQTQNNLTEMHFFDADTKYQELQEQKNGTSTKIINDFY